MCVCVCVWEHKAFSSRWPRLFCQTGSETETLFLLVDTNVKLLKTTTQLKQIADHHVVCLRYLKRLIFSSMKTPSRPIPVSSSFLRRNQKKACRWQEPKYYLYCTAAINMSTHLFTRLCFCQKVGTRVPKYQRWEHFKGTGPFKSQY